MTKLLVLFSALTATVFAGCSNEKMSFNKRDPSFYTRFVNPARDLGDAENKMSQLKIIEGREKYNMRYALFDNGKFFYEVNNLGSGYGDWQYSDGGVKMFAVRTFFDMDLHLSGKEQTGEAIVMRFTDRFGVNLVNVEFRDPVAQKPSALSTFQPSNKNL